jgi:DNA-binding response OmpR family regulator
MARILIVDADAEVREVLAYLLAHDGLCVRSASEADTALRMARSEPPDVVVTAINLLPVDGVELIQQLRRTPACSTLPAVIFTALSRQDVLERMGGTLLPGVVVLQKGGQPRRVVELVRRLLEERAG